MKNQQIHQLFSQIINYVCVVSRDVVRVTHHVTRHNMPIHNILSTAPQ
jgi:hypothetical protein